MDRWLEKRDRREQQSSRTAEYIDMVTIVQRRTQEIDAREKKEKQQKRRRSAEVGMWSKNMGFTGD